jgi:hypothetical protein
MRSLASATSPELRYVAWGSTKITSGTSITSMDAQNELLMYRHVLAQAASAIEQLKHCLLRHYDAHSAFANDRAALLDADLVLAEAYKLTTKEGK